MRNIWNIIKKYANKAVNLISTAFYWLMGTFVFFCIILSLTAFISVIAMVVLAVVKWAYTYLTVV